ncbi:MAG: hypothetical protein QHD01_16895 [Bradyrhizobium sp.]|uniref:hypothetical protein n=1 Tax=Bradyrhizobium sp. TaxID=376 RepID=UPI0029B7FB9F|nr:hypothetical protein [Bradyrhizobium sp.]MDX3968263.1 hypothetical protein [Bradyrhizobium sp.]
MDSLWGRSGTILSLRLAGDLVRGTGMGPGQRGAAVISYGLILDAEHAGDAAAKRASFAGALRRTRWASDLDETAGGTLHAI